MFIRFITSRLLRVIVCAAAGLYGSIFRATT